MQYEIVVEGQLEARWSAWFDGCTVTNRADGNTELRGTLADQAALHGLLQRLRDIGIPLVSVTAVQDSTDPGSSPDREGN